MIKLKNLWKIALATMAMSAMLVACDEPSKGGSGGSSSSFSVTYPSEAKISETGVYTVKLVKEGISDSGWGAANGKETIKVVLAPKTVVQNIIDDVITTDAELFIDSNKCYVYANNDCGNGEFTTASVTAEKYLQPAGYDEYVGLAITKDADGNYIAKVDVTQITKTLLLAKGANETRVTDEDDAWGAASNLKADYIPMILGSVTAANDMTYPFYFWNAGIAIMEPDTQVYPTAVTKEPVKVVSPLNEMAVVCSNFGNIDISFTDDIATAEVTYSLESLGWDQTELLDIEFGICADIEWSTKYTGAVITELDTEVTTTLGASDNNKIAKDILEADATYLITINGKNNSVKVTKK